jgi:hypothetical protein
VDNAPRETGSDADLTICPSCCPGENRERAESQPFAESPCWPQKRQCWQGGPASKAEEQVMLAHRKFLPLIMVLITVKIKIVRR